MSVTTQVLHRSARAISVSEFYDAIKATCVPRFPWTRGTNDRGIGVAVSGGVDSMALVCLLSQLRRRHPDFKIVDNTIGKVYTVIVDHNLREGSSAEAEKVAAAIREKTKFTTRILKIQWFKDGIVRGDQNPNDLPNIEAVARYHRYRKIARSCQDLQLATLLLAHHEDDQYETVLMKLMAGHGYRGLGGIRASNDIPECYDMHGAYQSGFVDDQLRSSPFWNMTPRSKQHIEVKNTLLHGVSLAGIRSEFERGVRANIDFDFLEDYEGIARGTRRVPPLTPLPIEDGGIMIYRPLLHFSKDRLIATCLENDIPWFEDHTNADPTYTTRNTVRYMAKNFRLPVALQKPAILRLAERCRARTAREEAEAERLFSHFWIRDFETGVGTAVVQVRPFIFPRPTRRALSSPARLQRRREHYRHIAALMIRRLLRLVTPERDLPLVSNLENLVSLLFPDLNDPALFKIASPPKGYTICGVQFTPLMGPYPFRWLLSRAPYPSNQPRPESNFWGLSFRKRYDKHPREWRSNTWDQWKLWDGRYWCRLRVRLPCKPRVAPFEPEHLKPFREALKDDNERARLSAVLRRYAPAKVRWSLPAIYATQDLAEEGKLRLLALPTLGFQVPNLEKWLSWEFRYRKVEGKTLRACLPGETLGRREAMTKKKRGYWEPSRWGAISRRGRNIAKAEAPGSGWFKLDEVDEPDTFWSEGSARDEMEEGKGH
ncbi:hypothetical protein B0T16DRAFT_432103 [Cercophora newfieldiana]|uniref:tRNA(Ile)-lysidine synthetase n=1 Tax=Cercophora newfieldiana TaxID=92897 RepID=A0AA39XS37_9PEZI|nr:hypothetical protein B0T16DRAFT_432103 [Cercophora newfieldiana]